MASPWLGDTVPSGLRPPQIRPRRNGPHRDRVFTAYEAIDYDLADEALTMREA